MATTQKPEYLTDPRTSECFDLRPECLTPVDHNWRDRVKLGISLYLRRGDETLEAMVARGPVASMN